MSERILLLIGLVALTIILGIAGKTDLKEVEQQHREYCEMVELYKQSDGENGWPPYKGECQ
jgi:hypothetical protein